MVGVGGVLPSTLADQLNTTFHFLTYVRLVGSIYSVGAYDGRAVGNGYDTVTVSGLANYPNLVVYDLKGVSVEIADAIGFAFYGGSSDTFVAPSIDPGSGSLVVAFVLTSSPKTTAMVGPGYALGRLSAGGMDSEFAISNGGATSSLSA